MSRIRRAAPKIKEPAEEERYAVEDAEDVPDTPDDVLEGETPEEAAERIIKKYKAKARSPGKAIRAFCVECVGGAVRDVSRCTARQCALFPFRHGRNPFHGRVGQPNLSIQKRISKK